MNMIMKRNVHKQLMYCTCSCTCSCSCTYMYMHMSKNLKFKNICMYMYWYQFANMFPFIFAYMHISCTFTFGCLSLSRKIQNSEHGIPRNSFCLSTYSCTTLVKQRNSEFRTSNAAEFRDTLSYAIPRNSAEINANTDCSSEFRGHPT
jgi:hypothetical protein